MARAEKNSNGSSTATVGTEQTLWAAADSLCKNMDAAEHKHVLPGLIFLKYISDTLEEQHSKLIADEKRPAKMNLANPPFNVSNRGGGRLAGDKRWHYRASPEGNANFLRARVA